MMDLCDAYRIPCDLNFLKLTYKVGKKTFRDPAKALAEVEFLVAAKKDPTLHLKRR